jgi:hypothetical protein
MVSCGQIKAVSNGATYAHPIQCGQKVCFSCGVVCSPYPLDSFLFLITWKVEKAGKNEAQEACLGLFNTVKVLSGESSTPVMSLISS